MIASSNTSAGSSAGGASNSCDLSQYFEANFGSERFALDFERHRNGARYDLLVGQPDCFANNVSDSEIICH
jgi:hypothetical protein